MNLIATIRPTRQQYPACQRLHVRAMRALRNFNRVLQGVSFDDAIGRARHRADYWWHTYERHARRMARITGTESPV